MTEPDVERLAELLRALPPAPEAWVQAAQELPLARKTMDELVSRAVADAKFRQALLQDLEGALAAEGYEPRPDLVAELRQRLRGE
jgi:hypothetical protein